MNRSGEGQAVRAQKRERRGPLRAVAAVKKKMGIDHGNHICLMCGGLRRNV